MELKPQEARRLCVSSLGIASLLLAAAIGSLPFAYLIFPLVPVFIASFASATGVLDLLTATLLFELYLIEGRSVLLGAACAYLVNAILVWPYGLTFPGVFEAAKYFSSEETAIWAWLVWHATFPILILAGAFVNRVEFARHYRVFQTKISIWSVLFVALAIMAYVLIERDHLPIVLHDSFYKPLFMGIAGTIAAMNFAALAVVMFYKSASLRVRAWLSVALFSSALDITLNALSPQRFCLPWYVGKAQMLVSASILLIALMRMWGKLYTESLVLSTDLHITKLKSSILKKELEFQHSIAAQLQQAALPYTLPVLEDVELSAVYRPAIHELDIGGDWYDAFVLEDQRLVLTIGDVAGKGLAAALIMSKVRQMLRMAAMTHPDPATMLDLSDRALTREHPDMLVTALVIILDRVKNEIVWACAGHPPAYVRHVDGTMFALESLSLPLGLRSDDPPSATLAFPGGSLLVAYTDGLVEAEHDIIIGCERVYKSLQDFALYEVMNPAQKLYDRLVVENAHDDIAIVAIKLLEAPFAPAL